MNAATIQLASRAANTETPAGVAVGPGYSETRAALSVGYQRQIQSNVLLSHGAAFSGSAHAAGVGMGIGW